MVLETVTLDQLHPGMTWRQKGMLGVWITVVAGVLIATYLWTEINPLKLYQKRENAVTYLFGKSLNAADLAAAREMAERMPAVIVQQEARRQVREEAAAQGRDLDFAGQQKAVEKRTADLLAVQSSEDTKRIVEGEYARLLDQKRGGFFPPETGWPRLQGYLLALLETVAIAIWGSLLAMVLAVPVSLYAAENTLRLLQGDGPGRRVLRWIVRVLVRRALDCCRGFNEFVMALIFVAVIGLGPFAGVLALAIHTFGVLGKVFSEAIEAIEPGQVEAVLASGATPMQVVAFAVLPQVMPLLVSYSLLRFESNVRSATILGFCGAGGIGFLMFDKLNGYQYREVASMMILVIVSVTMIDWLCGRLRTRFI